jgi:lipoprotein LpqH
MSAHGKIGVELVPPGCRHDCRRAGLAHYSRFWWDRQNVRMEVSALDNAVVVASLAAVVVVGLAGCSDSIPPAPPADISEGTAQITVGDQGLGPVHTVTCNSTEAITTISTGDDASGTTSAVDASKAPATLFVKIRNLAGFTGNYWEGVDGKAEVDMKGRVYTITGTATGFTDDSPSFRATKPFKIEVSC